MKSTTLSLLTTVFPSDGLRLLAILGMLQFLPLNADSIRVVVWDEQQPRQAEAYDHFLGNAIVDHLSHYGDLTVVSRNIDDPNKGIDEATLESCDVLVWWGHARNGEISAEEAKPIIERIKAGKLSLIALHSAHWATPFIEAMNERTRQDAAARYPNSPDYPRVRFEFVPPPGRFPPARDSIVTPAYYAWKRRGVVQSVRVDLPNCCFPDYQAHGKPSTLHTIEPRHPIANGVPPNLTIHQTEMYGEPFHVPEPDELVFKETWADGQWFRSGMVWNLGKGKIFYFRPGHEQYPIYRQAEIQRILLNAVRWLGRDQAGASVSAPQQLFEKENLVAWCIVPFDSKERSPAERARMLRRLGISRAAYDWREQHVSEFETEILEYQRHGIEYFAFWDAHEAAFDLFQKYSMSPQIWKTLPSPDSETQEEKIKAAANSLLPLVDRTKQIGSRLGLYNHGGWGGRPENLIAVCRYLRRIHGASHVGIVYNFHHGHEDISNFETSFPQMLPYLLCVNINGMNSQAEPKILDVGAGEHDQRLIQILIDSGYRGPIGILGHIASEDVSVVLGRNLNGLENIKQRLQYPGQESGNL